MLALFPKQYANALLRLLKTGENIISKTSEARNTLRSLAGSSMSR